MEKVDLSDYSFFELEPYSKVEVFINGVSRMTASNNSFGRLYVVLIPDELETDDLPF